MFKSLVIAPYKGMKDILEDVASMWPYEVHVEVGDLQDGLLIARSAKQQGYDVIISRGGTAELIRQHVDIPVIEIVVNGYDLLRSLILLKEYHGRIGIIGFPSIVDGVDTIAELLDMQVMKYVIHQEEEAKSAVLQAKEQGVNLIFGDVITVATAENCGMKAVLITSGREAIVEALEKAERIVASLRSEQQKIASLQSTLDALEEGVITVDSQDEIIYCNHCAAELFGLSDAMGVKWKTFMEKVNIHPRFERAEGSTQVITLKGGVEKTILMSANTLESGGVNYIFYDKDQIQYMDKQLRKAREELDSPAKSTFQQLVSTERINRAYMDRAKQWSRLKDPILLAGDHGTGKRTIAEAMHNESDYQEGPFVVCSPRLIPSERMDAQLFGTGAGQQRDIPYIRRVEGGTLYIEHIEELPLPLQSKLAAALRYDGSLFRLIASTSMDLTKEVEAGRFDHQLYSLLQMYKIQLPSLQMIIDDLEHLVFWFLAEMNRTLGKQVLGVKPEVIQLLKAYHWPGNVFELKRVVISLIEGCDSSFVTMKQAEPVLSLLFEAQKLQAGESIQQWIGESRNLEELEKDIIRIVLEQEGNNQSAAAKRLGINRTTLWRKLGN